MCEHAPNREAAMVTVQPGVWCDPCLVPLVKALNDGGLPTVASCCGHGTRAGKVALADGRELFILPSFGLARRADDLLATLPANACQRCGRDVGDGNPPAMSCSECPPVPCANCGEPNDHTCSCWVSIEGLPRADVKGLLARAGLSVEPT